MDHAHKNSDLIRLTIDLPEAEHTKLKVMAAKLKKSMRQVVIDLLFPILDKSEDLDNSSFQRELEKMHNDDNDLMKDLANK
jgi:hypothetical protein